MKIKHLFYAFAILLISCNSTEKIENNKITGSWQLTAVITFDKENTELDEKTRAKLGRDFQAKDLTLHFYPDSTYTELKGNDISHGQWSSISAKEVKYGNNKLIIEESLSGEESTEEDKGLILSLHNQDDNITSEMAFEALKSLPDYKKDPFYPANNTWRKKALKKETNKELIARLGNYVLHNAYLLKATYDRNTTSISFKNSQGIIRVYQSAIGVLKESKINKSWVDTFYDEEDAMKAYYLYKSYLGKDGVYKVKSTGDWVKDNYEILLKLYSDIQQTGDNEVDRFLK